MSSVRHDWYQTQQKVVIDILIKNAKERNCSVDIQSNIVLIRGDDISLDFHLAHEIDTAKSSFRILNVKIEISLQKLVGEAWSSLQKTNESTASFAPFPTQKPPEFYPRKGDKNWESIVKDVCEKEEIEKVRYILEYVNRYDIYKLHANHSFCRKTQKR